MRLNSSREDVRLKQEDNDQHHETSSLSSLRRQCNNPRIVRVSRAFGGKDRHSKVCTVRGLRDRRIRLSVTTAIQVYDLQDRLGLSQPSKVIDWLLEAAKNDVDLLPPLQFPPEFHQMINPNLTGLGQSTNFPWMFESFALGSRESVDLEKRKWAKFGQSSNLDHGFENDQYHFFNSIQSNKLYSPTSSSYHYNIGHLQQSVLDQSGNVTVAFPNNSNTNDLNQPALETVSSLFPRQPSFLGGGQLQLFGDHSNSLKQTDDHVE